MAVGQSHLVDPDRARLQTSPGSFAPSRGSSLDPDSCGREGDRAESWTLDRAPIVPQPDSATGPLSSIRHRRTVEIW